MYAAAALVAIGASLTVSGRVWLAFFVDRSCKFVHISGIRQKLEKRLSYLF